MTAAQPPASPETLEQPRLSAERMLHDLNNALMAALGSLDMIQRTLEPESAAAKYLPTLERALYRISARTAAFEQELGATRLQ